MPLSQCSAKRRRPPVAIQPVVGVTATAGGEELLEEVEGVVAPSGGDGGLHDGRGGAAVEVSGNCRPAGGRLGTSTRTDTPESSVSFESNGPPRTGWSRPRPGCPPGEWLDWEAGNVPLVTTRYTGGH